MAEPSNYPKPLAGNPPNYKRNLPPAAAAAAAAPPPPPKRPHITSVETIQDTSSNSDETLDTATSKPEEEEEDVDIDDDDVIRELSEYELRNGTNPVQDYDHMQRFCFPYIRMGVGNKSGWEAKIRHLKYKFNKKERVEFLPGCDIEEFLLWKKMFARAPPGDEESRVSSSSVP